LDSFILNPTNTMKTNTESTSSVPGAFLAAGLACIISLLGLTGCETGGSAEPIPASAAAARPTGALAPGDVINVTFSGAPEMNTKQKIQPNGKVSLPTVGDVSAAGKTITSFQAQLTSLYQPHLQDPTVVVGLETAAASVYVSGEVVNPGKVPLDRPMTALEAVMETGGFTKFANPKQVIVVRNEKGRTQRYVLNMNDTLSGFNNTPFYLRPFDVIYVKQSAW
ncbi:MAG TPA: polysaccharide biosynthesis/export family protein, partial [Luteolibacter sp.]|nr:polysaccharide biosynthesis/export family protein [Luteolibacter sp.]